MLVNGAGGGVGAFAVQIAKAYGADVTGVDNMEKLDMVRSLGADRVIDYAREDFTQIGERYNLIFDIPGNHPFSACRRVLTPDGKYVLIGHHLFGQGAGRWLGGILRVLRQTGSALPVREPVANPELLDAGQKVADGRLEGAPRTYMGRTFRSRTRGERASPVM